MKHFDRQLSSAIDALTDVEESMRNVTPMHVECVDEWRGRIEFAKECIAEAAMPKPLIVRWIDAVLGRAA